MKVPIEGDGHEQHVSHDETDCKERREERLQSKRRSPMQHDVESR
jgi:hypothetical protein